MPLLRQNHFRDEAAALAHVERLRWPDGPVCPHCGEGERIYALEGVRGHGGIVRQGLRKCGACRQQFTVRIGTLFERSHLPLHKWLQAIALSQDAGVSPHQLQHTLGVSYRTAATVLARLRETGEPIPAARPALQRRRQPIFIIGGGAFPLASIAPQPLGWWPMWGAAMPPSEMIFVG